MTPEERREYVRTNRTAVFGHDRKDDGPAMSLVHYASDPDGTIVVSTTAGRAKTRAVSRDGKVSLCVLDEQWPPTYLNVYCEATVDDDFDHAVDTMMRVGGAIAGQELDASVRPLLETKAKDEGRVTIRLRPYATFATAPGQTGPEDTPAGRPW